MEIDSRMMPVSNLGRDLAEGMTVPTKEESSPACHTVKLPFNDTNAIHYQTDGGLVSYEDLLGGEAPWLRDDPGIGTSASLMQQLRIVAQGVVEDSCLAQTNVKMRVQPFQ